jgi:hypothetical protein
VQCIAWLAMGHTRHLLTCPTAAGRQPAAGLQRWVRRAPAGGGVGDGEPWLSPAQHMSLSHTLLPPCLILGAAMTCSRLLHLPVQSAVRQVVELRRYSAWVTPASGVMLVAGGTYAVLSRLVPA